MTAHLRLQSTTGSVMDQARPHRQATHTRSQPAQQRSQTKSRKPWWKRFFCNSSNSPDPEDENAKPVEPPSAEMDEIDAKRQKRASYIPRHAGTDFSKTTTPLTSGDVDKAKRATLLYQRTQSDAEVKKAQKRATLIYQQGSIKVPARGSSDKDSESSSMKSPPLSPPIGLSFEQPATGHF